MTCARCRHRFSFPQCLAVWFPSRVPCPACRGLITLGWRGWAALAAVNAVGLLVLGWALHASAVGALAPHRALALVLAVSGLAPFVWWGLLQLLRATPASGDPGARHPAA